MDKILQENESDLPVVCSLNPAELGQRMAENNDFFQDCTQVTELADGYAFRFEMADETLGGILEFIRNERECCQFLRFELVFEPQLGPLRLQLRGGPDAKDFIRATFVKGQI